MNIRRMAASLRRQPEISQRRFTLSIRLQELTAKRIELDLCLAQAQAELKAMEEQIKSGEIAESPEVIAVLQSDPTLQSLRTQEVNLSMDCKFGVKDTDQDAKNDLTRRKKRLESIRKHISEREKRLIERQIKVLKMLRKKVLDSTMIQLAGVIERYNLAIVECQKTEKMMVELEALEEQREHLFSKTQMLDERLLDLRIRMPIFRPGEDPHMGFSAGLKCPRLVHVSQAK